jgi:murein L,D-transpeptidase YcbB/YkuD
MLTQNQRDYIANNYIEVTATQFVKDLGVSYKAVYNELNRIGVRSFDDDDMDFVQANKAKMTRKELAVTLEKTMATIGTIEDAVKERNKPTRHFGNWQKQDTPTHPSTGLNETVTDLKTSQNLSYGTGRAE